jgi:signal transduction histidine kinase
MMRRLAETARAMTQARNAWVARRVASGRAEVVTAVGSGAPEAGARVSAPRAHAAGRVVLPLEMDGAPLGWLVMDGLLGPATPELRRDLAPVTELCALAVHHQHLIRAAERRSAREMRRNYRLISGTVYHLKNALSVVAEYLDLIELETELTGPQRDYLKRARVSGRTAVRLLAELKSLRGLDAGMVVPGSEPVEIGVLIRDVLRAQTAAAAASGISFAFEHGPLPPVAGDADCVRQILVTLVSNAVRYSPAGARVTVRATVRRGRRASDPARWLRIDVVDMGPGVVEGEAVFDETQRIERAGVPGFRLAISRRTARLLGGDITLDTAPGAGATFSLWLPASEVTRPAGAASPGRVPAPPAGSGPGPSARAMRVWAGTAAR